MKQYTVTVIGLGLIGGSMAVDLKRRGFAREVIGVEADPVNAAAAEKIGLVDRVVSYGDCLAGTDVVILAVPVGEAVKMLPDILDRLASEASSGSCEESSAAGLCRKTVIDVCSTKAALVKAETPPLDPEGRKVIKSAGYRVQVYAGNNTRQAKNEAYAVASQIKDHFPDLAVYTSFNPPRWLCRAGDFRSIEEADAMMRKLRATGVFKEVSIVREQINLYL